MPLNITAASDPYGHYNLMPVYGISFCLYILIFNRTNATFLFKRIERLQHVEAPDARVDSGSC